MTDDGRRPALVRGAGVTDAEGRPTLARGAGVTEADQLVVGRLT